MKLAQALTMRKKLRSDFERLVGLISQQAYHIEGTKLPEKQPNEQVAALLSMMEDQVKLAQDINKTNFSTRLPNGMTVLEVLAKREVLAKCRGMMEALLRPQHPFSYAQKEAQKIELLLDLDKVKTILDDLSRQWRELDDCLQQGNWTIDLITD